MKKIKMLLPAMFCLAALNAQNVGIGTDSPQARLHVVGGLTVQADYVFPQNAPTLSQTFTLINGSTIFMPFLDSVARIFDPGGSAGNYTPNQNASFRATTWEPDAFLEFTIEDINLGFGDSLIIYDGPNSNAPILKKLGPGSGNNIKTSFSNESGFFLFKSNGDGSVGSGFSILINHRFLNQVDLPDPESVGGNSLLFFPRKGAFRSGWTGSAAPGMYSNAFGLQTVASGNYSTAMGANTTASGNSALAIGENSKATAYGSVALGYNATSSGDFSLAIGYGAKATGHDSHALGSNTLASSQSSTATGYNTWAAGALSTTMGYGTVARSSASLAIGRFNSILPEEDSTMLGWVGTDRILIVGNGSNESNRSNCFYIQKNGNAWLQGTLTQASDARLKKDIMPLLNVLPKPKKLSGYNYYWKEDRDLPGLQAGLIAQEVQAIIPEIVNQTGDGQLAVNYSGMIPYLLQGIKEQDEKIVTQQKRIEAMEAELATLKKMIQNK